MASSNNQAIPQVGADEYDVFLDYHNEDTEYAKGLLKMLHDAGYKAIDSDHYDYGTDILINLEESIKRCRKVVFVLSRTFLSKNWEMFKSNACLMNMLTKTKLVTVIPVLYNPPDCTNPLRDEDIPPRLAVLHYILSDGEDFKERFFSSINTNMTLHDALPAGNVSYGLAWSYFYGYLNFIVEDLPDRIMNCNTIWNPAPEERKISPRIFIVIPISGNCPSKFEDLDKRIQDLDSEEIGLKAHFRTRAGNVGRPYPAYAKSVRDPATNQEYFFVGEFATPVQVLHEMEINRISGLSQTEKYKQVRLFYHTLKDILSHPKAEHCKGKVLLYLYNDEDRNAAPLAETMVEMAQFLISQDIRNETPEDMRMDMY